VNPEMVDLEILQDQADLLVVVVSMVVDFVVKLSFVDSSMRFVSIDYTLYVCLWNSSS